jgi:hypothetical protein
MGCDERCVAREVVRTVDAKRGASVSQPPRWVATIVAHQWFPQCRGFSYNSVKVLIQMLSKASFANLV